MLNWGLQNQIVPQPTNKFFVGRDGVVGIATRYGSQGPGIEFR